MGHSKGLFYRLVKEYSTAGTLHLKEVWEKDKWNTDKWNQALENKRHGMILKNLESQRNSIENHIQSPYIQFPTSQI